MEYSTVALPELLALPVVEPRGSRCLELHRFPGLALKTICRLPSQELRVGKKYRLGRKIGSGSFGDIYLGTNMTTGEEVAIKLESVKTKQYSSIL